MNPEEIRISLGLKPFDEYIFQVYTNKREAIIQNYRGTGRTTKMLVHALSSLSNGQSIQLVAYNKKYAEQLKQKLLEWVNQLGLDIIPKQIITFSQDDSKKLRGFHGMPLYKDHYYG